MFTNDSRFKQGRKEVLIGVGLVIFNFLWWFGFAYGLGSARPEEYQYILGFPAWFFYSCIGSLVIMSILVVFFVKKYFVEVPFDDESNEEK
ncbi:YhdT family protein [Fervidibacillus halotolerans]|uniref:YhdT family protein n=1 Tax=Fervidibacillus halotolerans TaxID=2980027 RepID=A0A9E8M1X0_9BACI|nr:YhdT family protein [Fervidibacillus halotolerans]WAA14018.1 YhdT family protein [Fervidibacillus halotolerans]